MFATAHSSAADQNNMVLVAQLGCFCCNFPDDCLVYIALAVGKYSRAEFNDEQVLFHTLHAVKSAAWLRLFVYLYIKVTSHVQTAVCWSSFVVALQADGEFLLHWVLC